MTELRNRGLQDNASAFYESLPAEEAFALAQRFVFEYTPKAASWLNMIEIEFSAIARQWLHRRIPSMERLTTQVLALVNERDAKRINSSGNSQSLLPEPG